MAKDEITSEESLTQLESWLNSDVYLQNIAFWEKAWGAVKTPYTQLPNLPYIAQVPERLRQAQVRRVLDLGCGSGWLSVFLARSGFDVTGVDLSSHAVELGQTWAESEDLKIKFEAGDIANLHYPPGSFDAVVANSIFEHLTMELAEASLQCLKKAVSAGGLFFGCFDKVGGGPGEYYKLEDGTHVYTDKGRRGMLLRYFSDEELRNLFHGWNLVSLETLPSGSRIVWAKTPG